MLLWCNADGIAENVALALFQISFQDLAKTPSAAIRLCLQHVYIPVALANDDRRNLGKLRFFGLPRHNGVPLWPQYDLRIVRRRCRAQFALHYKTQGFRNNRRILGDTMIEVDDAVIFFPSIAMVESESGRQTMPAPFAEIILADDQNTRFISRLPDMGIEKAVRSRLCRVQVIGRYDDDQRFFGDDEIMDHAQRIELHDRCLDQLPGMIDVVKHQGRSGQKVVAEIPQSAVGIDFRVCGKARPFRLSFQDLNLRASSVR